MQNHTDPELDAPELTLLDEEPSVLEGYDPEFVEGFLPLLRPLAQYFRYEIEGLDRLPDGGALAVSNHSGGTLAMDLPLFGHAYYSELGMERPFFMLGHEMLFMTPAADTFRRAGLVEATRENCQAALEAGSVTMVFPGGDWDASRPTAEANTIDFAGRTGYVRSAIAGGVPIVPVVSIGGQETQLFLSRGTRIIDVLNGLVDRFGLDFRGAKAMPISLGFPFGLSVGPIGLNFPLPSKIRTTVLDPVDPADFDGDVDAIDEHVRTVMQAELDALASQRRLPIIG